MFQIWRKDILQGQRHKPFQLTFACSKSAIETLEKGVKYVQS